MERSDGCQHMRAEQPPFMALSAVSCARQDLLVRGEQRRVVSAGGEGCDGARPKTAGMVCRRPAPPGISSRFGDTSALRAQAGAAHTHTKPAGGCGESGAPGGACVR